MPKTPEKDCPEVKVGSPQLSVRNEKTSCEKINQYQSGKSLLLSPIESKKSFYSMTPQAVGAGFPGLRLVQQTQNAQQSVLRILGCGNFGESQKSVAEDDLRLAQ